MCGPVQEEADRKITPSSSCHEVGPLVDAFRSHVSRSLFKGLPWFLLTVQGLKVANPSTGLTLLWARNPFRGNFNHWLVSQKEAGQIFFKWRHGYEKGIITYIIKYSSSVVFTECQTKKEPGYWSEGPEIDPRWCHWGFFPWHSTIPCARGRLILLKWVPGYTWV
jgi:hypothetical protein